MAILKRHHLSDFQCGGVLELISLDEMLSVHRFEINKKPCNVIATIKGNAEDDWPDNEMFYWYAHFARLSRHCTPAVFVFSNTEGAIFSHELIILFGFTLIS